MERLNCSLSVFACSMSPIGECIFIGFSWLASDVSGSAPPAHSPPPPPPPPSAKAVRSQLYLAHWFPAVAGWAVPQLLKRKGEDKIWREWSDSTLFFMPFPRSDNWLQSRLLTVLVAYGVAMYNLYNRQAYGVVLKHFRLVNKRFESVSVIFYFRQQSLKKTCILSGHTACRILLPVQT